MAAAPHIVARASPPFTFVALQIQKVNRFDPSLKLDIGNNLRPSKVIYYYAYFKVNRMVTSPVLRYHFWFINVRPYSGNKTLLDKSGSARIQGTGTSAFNVPITNLNLAPHSDYAFMGMSATLTFGGVTLTKKRSLLLCAHGTHCDLNG
jgi:hypothetical protein